VKLLEKPNLQQNEGFARTLLTCFFCIYTHTEGARIQNITKAWHTDRHKGADHTTAQVHHAFENRYARHCEKSNP